MNYIFIIAMPKLGIIHNFDERKDVHRYAICKYYQTSMKKKKSIDCMSCVYVWLIINPLSGLDIKRLFFVCCQSLLSSMYSLSSRTEYHRFFFILDFGVQSLESKVQVLLCVLSSIILFLKFNKLYWFIRITFGTFEDCTQRIIGHPNTFL